MFCSTTEAMNDPLKTLLVAQSYKNFFGLIYSTIGVFPLYFDWGFADSNIILLKKVF